jgi:stress-induced morphogen
MQHGDPNVSVKRWWEPAKQSLPINSTRAGRESERRAMHASKANFSIRTSLEFAGKVTVSRLRHISKHLAREL